MVKLLFGCAAAILPTLLLAASPQSSPEDASDLLGRLDHLVYATPDLETGVSAIERLVGVRATPGGQHPGQGTRNALIALGPAQYMEIIGPDPDQPPPAQPRNFGIDGLNAPRLVTWAAKSSDLASVTRDAMAHGVTLGAIISGSRKRPDGIVLAWRYTNPRTVIADRLVPFFIDWADSPHPSQSAARGATLVGLRAEHPDPDGVRRSLSAVGLPLAVARADRPALVATITGPRGRVELR